MTEEQINRVAQEIDAQLEDDWTTADTVAFREFFGGRAAARLADAGLLADPELADWPRFAERDRKAALRTQAENERLVRERDALQEQLSVDSKRVYAAQVRAEELSATIDRVRTVLIDFGQLDKSNQTTALEALEKIDEIIDGGSSPAPRVFFPGDTVPAGTRGIDRDRWIFGDLRQPWVLHSGTRGDALVEIFEPVRDEWQAIVDRARAEREES